MIINLLILSIIVCFIVDLSGAVTSLKKFVLNIFKMNYVQPENFTFHPFDCSLCATFWTGLIYLIIVHQFTLFNLLIVCMLAFLSSNISGLLSWIKEFFVFIETKLFSLLKTK